MYNNVFDAFLIKIICLLKKLSTKVWFYARSKFVSIESDFYFKYFYGIKVNIFYNLK